MARVLRTVRTHRVRDGGPVRVGLVLVATLRLRGIPATVIEPGMQIAAGHRLDWLRGVRAPLIAG